MGLNLIRIMLGDTPAREYVRRMLAKLRHSVATAYSRA
jgi:hypothetical protein